MARLCLFGASDDTGNLGVSALLRAVLAGIAERAPAVELVVFDHRPGEAEVLATIGDRAVTYRRVGAPVTRRLQRPEAFARLAAGARLGVPVHPGVGPLRDAGAVLAISGGDSFADLYGTRRLRAMVAPMRLARRLRRPLVLLPQTYGPFRSASSRRRAEAIVRGATACWARDADGYAELVRLAGADHDPARQRLGVDVAHLLPTAADGVVTHHYAGLGPLAPGPGSREQVAINVSGLLANGASRPGGGRAAAYREAMLGLVQHVLRTDPDAAVVLVPHVVGGAPESDERPTRELADTLGPRVVAAPPVGDPSIVKGLIARSSWFCGARMHATIGALSAGVPAAAVAYSDKFRGSFADLGREDHVADARRSSPGELVERLIASYESRHADRAELARRAAHVRIRAEGQLDEILATTGLPTVPRPPAEAFA